MTRRVFAASFFMAVLCGCHKNYNTKDDHTLSDLMKRDKLFSDKDADRLEALIYETRATRKISTSDLEWALGFLKDCDFKDTKCIRRATMISSAIYSVDNFSSYPAPLRETLFEIGKKETESANGDFMVLNYSLGFLEKSGDKRAIPIATAYLNHPHWSVRSCAKSCVLHLKGV